MKTESKILAIVVIIVFIFCLIYKSDKSESKESKELKETFAVPSTTTEPPLYDDVTMDKTLNELNQFAQDLTSVNPEQVDPTKLQDMQNEILDNIKSLNATIYQNSLRLEQQNIDNESLVQYKDATDLAETADIKASQLMQNSYIKKLQERLESLKLTYENISNNQALKAYPKIPVYSSCVVSEANGSYSLDNNKTAQSAPGTAALAPSNSRFNGRSVYPSVSSYNPMMNATPKTENGFTLDDIIEQISKNGVNINFNV